MSDEKENSVAAENDPSEPAESLEQAEETIAEESGQHGANRESVLTEKLESELEVALEEARGNWEKLLRSQAELENLRRRSKRELEDAHKFAVENFTRELLPVLDSLELGIQAASQDGTNHDAVKLREGNELILQQLRSVFGKFNIEVVDPVGETFNPEFHQAMTMEACDEAEPNTVIKVFQKGYLLNQRLIRAAMVVVAKATDSQKTNKQA